MGEVTALVVLRTASLRAGLDCYSPSGLNTSANSGDSRFGVRWSLTQGSRRDSQSHFVVAAGGLPGAGIAAAAAAGSGGGAWKTMIELVKRLAFGISTLRSGSCSVV